MTSFLISPLEIKPRVSEILFGFSIDLQSKGSSNVNTIRQRRWRLNVPEATLVSQLWISINQPNHYQWDMLQIMLQIVSKCWYCALTGPSWSSVARIYDDNLFSSSSFYGRVRTKANDVVIGQQLFYDEPNVLLANEEPLFRTKRRLQRPVVVERGR